MSKCARIKWLISAVVLTGFCHASHAQIKLVGLNPHAIPVDKNGAGSAFITLQNQGPAAAPLRLSITDFVHLENGRAMYPLNSLPVLTPSTDADKQKVNNHQLAANETVDFKLAVTQLWDAGESVAELQNSGVKIDKLRAVRIPASYNVQLDPSSASVLLAPDSAALVTIVNADPMDYRFSWELLTRGKISRDPDRPAVTVPANGSALINLSRAAPRVSWVAAGTLKDDVADSTLVLHPAIEAQDGIPPQAPKMLPFKLRLSFWSAVPQQVSEFFWTMLLLLAGALASMAARYFIPNAVGALKLRRQLDQLDGKVAGMSDNVSSKWQVLLAYNLETCRAGLHDFPWAFPAFATRLADLQVQADMFSQWVNTAYGVGSALDQVSPLLQNGRMPPTVLDLVEQSCQAALQPIESGMTNADELQGMKTAFKTAQDLIAAVRTGVPIPTLDGKIQEREKRLQAAGVMDALFARFPEFAGLLTQVAANLGAALSAAVYVDRDMLSQKAEMLMEYASLEQRIGAGALLQAGVFHQHFGFLRQHVAVHIHRGTERRAQIGRHLRQQAGELRKPCKESVHHAGGLKTFLAFLNLPIQGRYGHAGPHSGDQILGGFQRRLHALQLVGIGHSGFDRLQSCLAALLHQVEHGGGHPAVLQERANLVERGPHSVGGIHPLAEHIRLDL